MPGDLDQASAGPGPPAHQRGADGTDLVRTALDHLRGVHPASGGASGSPTIARQKENLRGWAAGLGLLLNPEAILARFTRGGQEHDYFREGERVFKITREGVFGLSPGIALALVSSGEDARRFHLLEASPLQYLERLHLQN